MVVWEIEKYYNEYSDTKCIIGYSYYNRPIYAFHIGKKDGMQFISTYAIHAREWITAYLALKHIKFSVPQFGGWIIPLVNPDGAMIAQSIAKSWKANGRGVDLNCNFDANWGCGVKNTRQRGEANGIGDYPFSELESIAIRDFTIKIAPKVTFSWHTKGEEIYWQYRGEGEIQGAKLLSKATGYPLKTIYGSTGGYKDWCIQKLKIPSYTIECGSDALEHPITKIRQLKKCYHALEFFMKNYEK